MNPMPESRVCYTFAENVKYIEEIAKWAKTESWADYMYEHDERPCNEHADNDEWKTVSRGRGRRGRGRHTDQWRRR